MSRRQRKDKKRKQKRLERVPEKLQRKRDRQERQRTRRMPGWVRTGLVVVLIAVIIGGSVWVWSTQLPDPIPPPPNPGAVYVLQQDTFYVYINDTGQVQVDFMVGRYAGGTFGGDQPLNISITRDFDIGQMNFTFLDPYVFYDYFGNAYYVPPDVGADTLEYFVGEINPNMIYDYEESHFRGGATMRGYYSLFWNYVLNSSENTWLETDTMDDMYTFTFDIQAENDTIPYNTPTTVYCNITFNTLKPVETNVYNWGESQLLFHKQVFNETALLANITVQDVHRIGSILDPELTSSNYIDNETHIGFIANPITTSMSQNQSWGYTFDLNVTSFTNASFCLLDLSTPENEFFLQSGFTGAVLEQPMHFPKAEIDIQTPFVDRIKKNFTDIIIRFPDVCLNNGTVFYQSQPDLFEPFIPSILEPSGPSMSTAPHVIEEGTTDSSNLDLQTLTLFSNPRRLYFIKQALNLM
ncbi:MAG: hypothetical protein ACXACH_02405 [Candidatus Hermodarchaeia archaeon]